VRLSANAGGPLYRRCIARRIRRDLIQRRRIASGFVDLRGRGALAPIVLFLASP
jgi:hypothetical protein